MLVNGDESYPVGMWLNNWEAGYVTAEVAEILLKAFVRGSLFPFDCALPPNRACVMVFATMSHASHAKSSAFRPKTSENAVSLKASALFSPFF